MSRAEVPDPEIAGFGLPTQHGVEDERLESDDLGVKETSESVAAQPERQPQREWLVPEIHSASVTENSRRPSSQAKLCDHRLPTLCAA